MVFTDVYCLVQDGQSSDDGSLAPSSHTGAPYTRRKAIASRDGDEACPSWAIAIAVSIWGKAVPPSTSWPGTSTPWNRSNWKSIHAKSAIFIRASDGTGLGNGSDAPAVAGLTAALHFRHSARELLCTATVHQARETRACSLIDAPRAICGGYVSTRTHTKIASHGVGAFAGFTYPRNDAALIDVFALLGSFTLLVTSRAPALKRAHSVDTTSSLAYPRDGLALVNILAGSSADVGDEAPAAGLRLGRAHLTGMAPGPPDGGTAQRLGADDACQLPLAHLVVDLSETRARPVISFTLRAGESINTRAAVRSNTTPAVLATIVTDRLSTVSSNVSLLALAVVISAGPSIHASHTALLN